jgi:hypothetical protein
MSISPTQVRGMIRAKRGRRLRTPVRRDRVELGYRGLHGVTRRTRIELSPAPRRLTADHAGFVLDLPPHGSLTVDLTAHCLAGDRDVPRLGTRRHLDDALGHAMESARAARARDALQRAVQRMGGTLRRRPAPEDHVHPGRPLSLCRPPRGQHGVRP